jgi:4-alpha-glucanotransferase
VAVNEGLISELSELCGIIPDYWDILGTQHWASSATKTAILRGMGIAVEDENAVRREIALRRGRPWNRLLEPVLVVSVSAQPVEISCCLPIPPESLPGLSIDMIIQDELGQTCLLPHSGADMVPADHAVIDGQPYVRILLKDTFMRGIGYYQVTVSCRHQQPVLHQGRTACEGSTVLIITPDACYLPPSLERGKIWGVSANLYAIRSASNCGVGDLRDLGLLVRAVAGHGGGFVGINPLHSIPNRPPFGISPYSPISRLFKNYLYLSLEDIPDVAECPVCREMMKSALWQSQVNTQRFAERINYEAVAALKMPVLSQAFEHFYDQHYLPGSERGAAFGRFVAEQGSMLEGYATFFALWKVMHAEKGCFTWQEWPEEYRNPFSPAVAAFRKENERLVHYFMYIQWLLESQHESAAAMARECGMPIGLYHDLAIGSIGNGSDVWMAQDLFASGIDVGAPLDDFNPTGQNWGFPPLLPERLRETGYAYFIETIRRNMRHAGAIRIDHALGLFRLFWIPRGELPLQGAYVRCHAEEMIRIIALESVRNNTVVIAEDLGTFGDGMREMLQSFRMLSFRLLYFERYYPDLWFRSPEDYPEMAISAVTTHDLPTLGGFWVGSDIDLKEQLNLFPNPERIAQYRADRLGDRTRLVRVLKQRGLVRQDYPEAPEELPMLTPELSLAIYAYLAQSRSKLLNVMLDDVVGSLRQMNLPGTVDEYPNWVQKMPVPLEEIADLPWLRQLAEACRKYGR